MPDISHDFHNSPVPAKTLAKDCYRVMFSGCSYLTTAPELPATNLADYCYAGMFNDCTSLNSITVHFTKWVDASWSNATWDWVNGVADSGQFHCPAGLIDHDPLLDIDFGEDKIPKDSSHKWTVIKDVPNPTP